MTTKPETKTHRIHTTYNHETGGWSAEIYDNQTGDVVYSTEKTFLTSRSAHIAAMYWLEDYTLSAK